MKKWRNNPPPELPADTLAQAEVGLEFVKMILEAIDSDMKEADIEPGSPEGQELIAIKNLLVGRANNLRERFDIKN